MASATACNPTSASEWPVQPGLAIDHSTTQNQRSPVVKPVHIEALADPQPGHPATSARARITWRSDGVVIFGFGYCGDHARTRIPAASSRLDSSVHSPPAAGRLPGLLQGSHPKDLGRERQAEAFAIYGLGHQIVRGDPFDRVGDPRGQDGAVRIPESVDHAQDIAGIDQRPGGVVDRHHLGAEVDCSVHAGADRILPPYASAHQYRFGENRAKSTAPLLQTFWCDHHDQRSRRDRRHHSTEGCLKNRSVSECLRQLVATEPGTPTGANAHEAQF